MPTFVIAEAGVNHNGDVGLAKKLIDAAVSSGADAVKFQTFVPEAVVSRFAEKAAYQKETTGAGESQLEMIRKLQLDEAAHRELFAYCGARGIQFLSTPFDLPSIALLQRLGLTRFKIPSGEITNPPYLRALGKLHAQLILSTGMAEMAEVARALTVLEEAGTPRRDVVVLHCHSNYPTRMEDVNLRAMLSIRDTLGVRVGYSDHTLGIEVATVAVALGAEVIEKHFTLDRRMAGPDHKASLEPLELTAMVRAIRNIEAALGDGVKRPTQAEQNVRDVARKSIVAARAIRGGELLTEENITTKRPGTGVSAMEWDAVLGTRARRDFSEDELIEIS